MDRDSDKVALIYSVMLTLPGTPVIYYGDEYGKLNDETYYKEAIQATGKDDTRFLVRGRIDWNTLESEMSNPDSLTSRVFHSLSNMIKARKKYKAFGRGGIDWKRALNTHGQYEESVLMYTRSFDNEKILVVQNLSDKEINIKLDFDQLYDITGKTLFQKEGMIRLKRYEYYWIDQNK